MTVLHVLRCDNCNKLCDPVEGKPDKLPLGWFQRDDEQTSKKLHACSIECAMKINEKTGKKAEIIP